MICVQRPGIEVLRGVTSLWDDGEPGLLTCGLEERSERAGESRRNVGLRLSTQFKRCTIRCRRSFQDTVERERRGTRGETAE